MSLKTFPVYDHPTYATRVGTFNSIMAAGSGGVSAKFTAFANLLLFSLNTYVTIAGTSTYTTGLLGGPTGATVAVAATQLSLIRITNTATAGATIGLSTSTIGPFTVAGVFLGAGNTATNQIGAYNQFTLSTGTGAMGGVPINQGDQIFVVNGTDLTAVELVSIDYQVAPLAAVTA